MTKRLLRSVIEFDQEVSNPNLVRNFERLRKAVQAGTITWGRPDDEGIFRFVEGFFLQYCEMPSGHTVLDYFKGINRIDVTERVGDIAVERVYARTNYFELLRTLQEDQARVKAHQIIKDTNEILIKGKTDEKTGEITKGLDPAVEYFTKHMQDLRVTENNAQITGDIRTDGAKIREEYERAENDRGRALGAISGIHEIDDACKGAKRGELWIHAAFPGELKCVSGDATVLDHATGRRRSIKDLFDSGDRPTVTALEQEGQTHRLIEAQASRVVQNGVRDVYLLTTSSGRSLPASANHKVFTSNGWRRLDELKAMDWVAVPAVLRAAPPKRFSPAEVKVVGYLLGDGSLTAGNLTLTAENAAIRGDFKKCLSEMGLREGESSREWAHFVECFPTGRAPYIRVGRNPGVEAYRGPVSPVFKLLVNLGMMEMDAYSKSIPEDFFGLPDKQVALLLGALWATDGACHTGEHERDDRTSPSRRRDISYASVSRALCSGIQSLLLRLGIQSSVSQVDTTYHGEPYAFYCIRVATNPSKRRFVELVKVVGKEEQFSQLAASLPVNDNRPFPTSFISEGAKVRWVGARGERWRYATNTKKRSCCHADTLALFAADAEVAKALAGDLAWEQVASVRFRSREMTYDLSVPDHQSFVVNDIVTHNTTFACNWAYNSMTRFKKNVVFVSFEMTREQIRRSILVQHSANIRFREMGFSPLDYGRIRDGELTPEEKDFYFNHVVKDFEDNKTYTNFQLVTPDCEWTMQNVKTQLETLHREFEVGLVILDHGQWIEASKARKNKDYTIELNSVITDAKRLALTFDNNTGIPVIMLFQINRTGKTDADKNDGIYKMNALTYANNAEKTADVITTTYLNEELRKNGQTKFTNLKNRDNRLFDPFVAHVEFACRKITSLDRQGSEGFVVDDFDAMMGDGVDVQV
jgi:replicative DNA helicase